MNIAEQTFWLVGASSGIGRSLALKLAAQGANVAVSARNAEALSELQGLAESMSGNIHAFPLDATDRHTCHQVLVEINKILGPVHISILNAGVYQPMTVSDFDAQACEQIFTVNVMSAINCLEALLHKADGLEQVLITASVAGYRGLPLAGAYGASKAALINLAEGFRPGFLRRGIQLRVINPGFVETPMTAKNTFKMPALITAEEAASEIIEGLSRTSFEITFPKRFTWWLKLLRVLPYYCYFPLLNRLKP
ncbi:SDR family NAD(P)-dependent oxidoreductase [Zooshikella harenae]|uniref:SDR family NAD(P)-dependent oxidoreductase n=1 Tax=Zooshikella harenae TaxID=2827238 RepID=A0ABS5Z999_9GAMM|nr:SDR family NAD(P)-dependent oxidoreductase [Zooshikella harenae]MBU2709875.1 SDR family NAD(P)-dependent oxidoreductase [Zooshikella harenae]